MYLNLNHMQMKLIQYFSITCCNKDNLLFALFFIWEIVSFSIVFEKMFVPITPVYY